jgi:hypothetical protein
MKTAKGRDKFTQAFKNTIVCPIIVASLLFGEGRVWAQMSLNQSGGVAQPAAPGQTPTPDSAVQITAEMQGLQAVEYGDLPMFGTYWEVMPGGCMAPLPGPFFNPSLATYAITDNIFLVDATYGQLVVNPRLTATMSATSATTAAVQAEATAVANLIDQVQAASASSVAASPTQMSVMSSGVSGPPGFGDLGSGGGTPAGGPEIVVNYSTNLWIAQWNVGSDTATGVASNTVPDVEYEMQSLSDLTQTNWSSLGFFLGSEGTNWTPLNPLAVSLTNNFFLRLRSWISSDGSGLPDWWEALYFGTNTVNPDAQDSAGDGYTIYQKYELGVSPGTFLTPPAPPGLSVSYNSHGGTVAVSWQPSQGLVTGYTVTRFNPNTYSTTQFSFSTNTTSFVDSSPITVFPPENGEPTYTIQALYSRGNSLAKTLTMFTPGMAVSAQIMQGSQGQNELLVQGPIPAGTTNLLLTRSDFDWDTYEYKENTFSLALSSLNNDTAVLPGGWFNPSNIVDDTEDWYVQTAGSNGTVSDMTEADSLLWSQGGGGPTQFLDGRQQLVQNADFLLRVANAYWTLGYQDSSGYESYYPNYSYAGLYDVTYISGDYTNSPNINNNLDEYRPFVENYFFHNFVFSLNDIDPATGLLTTGLGLYEWSGVVSLGGPVENFINATISTQPTYQFQSWNTSSTTIPAILDPTQTPWTCFLPQTEINYGYPNPDPLSCYGATGSDGGYAMTTPATNFFGLPFLSTRFAYNANGTLETPVLEAGHTISGVTNGGFFSQTAIPSLKTVGYYFAQPASYPLPGQNAFTTDLPNNTNNLVAGFGQATLFAGYAQQELLNGDTNVYSYLGQYFDQAYQIDSNGNVTTNSAGVISPYGEYVATAVGPVALVTMTNWGENVRGTGIVQVVKLVLDVNHDGTMDLSCNGPDNTSVDSPYVFWANNNFDRWYFDADDATNYLDDVQISGCAYTPNVPTPDYDYLDTNGDRVIPNTRDLEDFTRLWVCGIDTNLIAKLPTGSTITLSWGDVGNPNSGNPTIDLFTAAEADGGIGYLTNATIAAEQINTEDADYVGRLAPGGSLLLNNPNAFGGWTGTHFIWCGVSNGIGGLTLTIADANSNVLAQTTAYIQIVDIKQMYERYTVGDQLSVAPLTNAILATEGLPVGAPAFQYPAPQGTNTPYILFVHGWNMETWEKDRFAETAFKRLFWQGYQGRFGEFRWPTGNGFTGVSTIATNLAEKDNYDSSEYNAWVSGQGLLNKLNNLNAEYPGQVYLLAHSMGNVVAGEALRLAGANRVVNTYVGSQAAISAHTYDENTNDVPNYSFYYPPWSANPNTPNIYGDWFTGDNGGGAGKVISLFNTNDFALQRSVWQLNQLFKPDQYVLEDGTHWNYGYNGSAYSPPPWNEFYKQLQNGLGTEYFDIVNVLTNRYEVSGYAAQSWTTALGATPNVGNLTRSLNLNTVWPSPDPLGKNYASHFYHSAQFHGDTIWEWNYWNTLLFSSQTGFNISNP